MYDLDKVKTVAETAVEEILNYKGDYVYPGETSTYSLELIAGDWRGVYQSEHIIEQFNLRLKNDDWVWESLDRIFWDVADLLNKAIPLLHPEFEYLALSFGHAEYRA